MTRAFSIRGADTFWAKSTGFPGVISKRSAAEDRFHEGAGDGRMLLFGGVNCAENLLRGKPQYNIARSNRGIS